MRACHSADRLSAVSVDGIGSGDAAKLTITVRTRRRASEHGRRPSNLELQRAATRTNGADGAGALQTEDDRIIRGQIASGRETGVRSLRYCPATDWFSATSSRATHSTDDFGRLLLVLSNEFVSLSKREKKHEDQLPQTDRASAFVVDLVKYASRLV